MIYLVTALTNSPAVVFGAPRVNPVLLLKFNPLAVLVVVPVPKPPRPVK